MALNKKILWKKNKKWFWVVESFLAMTVFSMISFVSIAGYSTEAKNAKVSSDLSTITMDINTKMAEWAALMSFVTGNNKNRLTNLSLAGKKATERNYMVWTPNYTALGIRRNEFLDPNGNDYVLWVTTTWWWRMEIAWVLTINWEKQTVIKWDYIWRNATKYDIAHISWKIIVLTPAGTNYLKNWDYVRIWPVRYTIEKVARDGITITLDKEVIWKFTKVSLVEAEWKSLISDYRDNTKALENGLINSLPY